MCIRLPSPFGQPLARPGSVDGAGAGALRVVLAVDCSQTTNVPWTMASPSGRYWFSAGLPFIVRSRASFNMGLSQALATARQVSTGSGCPPGCGWHPPRTGGGESVVKRLTALETDAYDQVLVIETLSRIYAGLVTTEEIRRAVESAWGELVVMGRDRDFLSVRVARRVRQTLDAGRLPAGSTV